jgi:hypothetical protein
MILYDTLPPVLPEFETPTPAPAPESAQVLETTPKPRFEPPDLVPGSQTEHASAVDDLKSKQSGHRLWGKIARLADATRERLNKLLHDGLGYREVIAELGDDGAHLTESDLSRWRNQGGHDLWLQKEQWLARMQASFDAAKELAGDSNAQYIYEASLHLAATQMYNSLIGCDPQDLPDLVKKDPDKYFKVLQAIPRFAQQALNYQKFREDCARAKNEVSRLRDPHRELTDAERNAILDKLDRILGFK